MRTLLIVVLSGCACPSVNAQLRPTQSIVDFLKAKKQDSSFAARKVLYAERFGNGQSFSGSKDENARLLRTLLAHENHSCCGLSNCILTHADGTIALIGGFGWGSRGLAAPPDIWSLKPGAACELESGVFGILGQTFQGDWNEAGELAKLISSRVSKQVNKGPVVVIGHSFGAGGAIETTRELGRLGVKVDLLVALDAINPSSPIRGNTITLPDSCVNFVHIAAAKKHWAITVPQLKGNAVEYVVEKTTHTDIDSSHEAHEIIRHLIALLPNSGVNQAAPDYFVPSFPKSSNDFPRKTRTLWKRAVTVSRYE